MKKTVKKTYDDLKKPDKDKYLAMLFYENNALHSIGWYMMMVTGVLVAVFVLIPLTGRFEGLVYAVYGIFVVGVLGFMAIERAIKLRKEMHEELGRLQMEKRELEKRIKEIEGSREKQLGNELISALEKNPEIVNQISEIILQAMGHKK